MGWREYLKLNLEMSEKIFFEIPRSCDRLMGLWPSDVISTPHQMMHATSSVMMLLIGGMCQWAFIYKHLDNIVQILPVVIPSASLSVTLFKSIILVKAKPGLRRIINYLHDQWYKDEDAKKFEAINLNMNKYAHWLSLSILFAASAVVTTSILAPIIMNIHHLIVGKEIDRVLSFVSEYPFDITTSPGYEIAYTFISSVSLYVVLGMVGADCKVITICMYLSAQFQIVRSEINDLIATELGTIFPAGEIMFSPEQNDKIYKKMGKIINRHAKAIQVSYDMIDTLASMILLHFITASTILGAACVGLMTLEDNFVYVFHGMTVLSQLFLYCVGGAVLYETSCDISITAYNFLWYKSDKRIRNMVYLMIMNSQEGILIKVPFFTASMESFLNIVRKAGSYITLMKSFM